MYDDIRLAWKRGLWPIQVWCRLASSGRLLTHRSDAFWSSAVRNDSRREHCGRNSGVREPRSRHACRVCRPPVASLELGFPSLRLKSWKTMNFQQYAFNVRSQNRSPGSGGPRAGLSSHQKCVRLVAGTSPNTVTEGAGRNMGRATVDFGLANREKMTFKSAVVPSDWLWAVSWHSLAAELGYYIDVWPRCCKRLGEAFSPS